LLQKSLDLSGLGKLPPSMT